MNPGLHSNPLANSPSPRQIEKKNKTKSKLTTSEVFKFCSLYLREEALI